MVSLCGQSVWSVSVVSVVSVVSGDAAPCLGCLQPVSRPPRDCVIGYMLVWDDGIEDALTIDGILYRSHSSPFMGVMGY